MRLNKVRLMENCMSVCAAQRSEEECHWAASSSANSQSSFSGFDFRYLTDINSKKKCVWITLGTCFTSDGIFRRSDSNKKISNTSVAAIRQNVIIRTFISPLKTVFYPISNVPCVWLNESPCFIAGVSYDSSVLGGSRRRLAEGVLAPLHHGL